MDEGARRARLAAAREEERRRGLQQPLRVDYREVRARDGQVVISLCSEDEDSKSEEDACSDEDEGGGHTLGGADYWRGAYAYDAPTVKQEVGRANVLDVLADAVAVASGELDAAMDSDDSDGGPVDVDLTADTDDDASYGDVEYHQEEVIEHVKAEPAIGEVERLTQDSDDQLAHVSDDQLAQDYEQLACESDPDDADSPPDERFVGSPVDSPVAERPSRPINHGEWSVRKLDEVDAAYALFDGDREIPSATVLRMIIDYIAASVGVSDAYLLRFVKHAIWLKLNATVENCLEDERQAQSEWMKIVFEERPPRHRHRRGPMARVPLLRRPVQITVRSMQFGGPIQNESSTRGANRVRSRGGGSRKLIQAEDETHEVEYKNEKRLGSSNISKAKTGLPPRKPKVKQYTISKRPMSDQNEFFGTSPVISMSPTVSSPPFTPRKHRRRSSSPPPVTPRQILRAKGAQGQSISHDLMKPLPDGVRVLGENRSLPLGWTEKLLGSSYRSFQYHPRDVDPLCYMTTDQISSHIKAVQREGRVENFEHATEILSKLMSHPRNTHGIYNVPVDPVALNLPLYTTIVKNPMDLGTIKAKLAQGEYVEMDDFVADVRLVFENAMLFNPKNHYVHVHADILLGHFENAIRAERERQQRRTNPSRHICLSCRGNQCSGCGADIRKGSIYFATRDGTRVYCQKCKTRMDRDGDGASQRSSLAGSQNKSVADDDGTESTRSSQLGSDDLTLNSSGLQKLKCEVGVEPWVRCTSCDKWLHQVCGLYNPVVGVYAREHEYVCPLCCLRRRQKEKPVEDTISMRKDDAVVPSWSPALVGAPDSDSQSQSIDVTSGESSSSAGSSSYGNGGKDVGKGYRGGSFDENHRVSGHNIPRCELSDFIEDFLQRELRAVGEHDAANSLYVRVLSFPNEQLTVSEPIFNAFEENCNALCQLRPESSDRAESQRLPRHINYLSRGVYLFQKHDGVDVCLFTLFTQEFGDSCALETNRRSVYIAYLDSVRYLTPPSARTAAYHFIMLAYFDYIRRHGFRTVHIWSCPPQKRISYVFWCRPPFQKTPSAEHLRLWYKNLLQKAKDRGIVNDWTTSFARYFAVGAATGSTNQAGSEGQAASPGGNGVATRGFTSRSIDPSDLEWPAPQLPPLFDGDLILSEFDRAVGVITAKNEKKNRAAASNPFYVKGSAGSTGGKRVAPSGAGDLAFRVKPEEHLEPSALASTVHVDVKLREMFTKCHFAVQRLKNDLLVVDLCVDNVNGVTDSRCEPEALVPEWCARVPRFFGSRFMFHQLCSHAGYQFDSLRRAKHSTMMVLHHYFNERAVVQANIFCRDCCLLITHAKYWACRSCDRFALCDACHQRLGPQHAHPMRFGTHLDADEDDADEMAGQRSRSPSL